MTDDIYKYFMNISFFYLFLYHIISLNLSMKMINILYHPKGLDTLKEINN